MPAGTVGVERLDAGDAECSVCLAFGCAGERIERDTECLCQITELGPTWVADAAFDRGQVGGVHPGRAGERLDGETADVAQPADSAAKIGPWWERAA